MRVLCPPPDAPDGHHCERAVASMKNLKRAELAIISLTALSLAFTAGFFVGRGASGSLVTIEKLTAADKPSISASPPAGHIAEDIPMISDNGDKGAADADVGTNVSGGQTSIPSAAVTAGAPEPDASGDGEAVGLININTASAAELETLPGIGDVLAGRIIEYRELNGGFRSVEEITAVSGIGEKKFGDIKDRITVG